MAEAVCRACGGSVAAGATVCPHCGAADPVAGTTDPVPRTGTDPVARPTADPATGPAADPLAARASTGPAPERNTAGSRMKGAAKAIGCFVLALIVLAIAVVVGVFDIFF